MLRHAAVIFFAFQLCDSITVASHRCPDPSQQAGDCSFDGGNEKYFFISAKLGDCAADKCDQMRRCCNYQRPVEVGAVEAYLQAVGIQCERGISISPYLPGLDIVHRFMFKKVWEVANSSLTCQLHDWQESHCGLSYILCFFYIINICCTQKSCTFPNLSTCQIQGNTANWHMLHAEVM